ncbi:MAG: phosphoribosyltransferase [Candidatus Aenigmarchaeota archaeon]|nr:phosphoribosyltransferase [Candidatus Aenigmarchaeota archaeon]
MKKIQEINLDEIYEDEILSVKPYTFNYKLADYLEMIQEENNPLDFKEQLLAVTQLYYDGILRDQFWSGNFFGLKSKEFSLKLEILDKLILSGKIAVGSFYEGKGIDADEVRSIFMPYISDILRYGNAETPSKTRHLRFNWSDVQDFGIALQERLDYKVKFPDVIVSVASGGLEPAYLAMHVTEKDDLFVLRYSTEKEDSGVQVFGKDKDYFDGKNLKDKNVFVIDDIIETGTTMFNVLRYIFNLKPSELYGSSVYTRFITPIKPYIEIIDSKPFLFRYAADC